MTFNSPPLLVLYYDKHTLYTFYVVLILHERLLDLGSCFLHDTYPSLLPHTHTHTHTQEAEVLGNKDKLRLLSSRKLALIIDLDQTLIHTSVDPNVEPGLPVSAFYHGQLYLQS